MNLSIVCFQAEELATEEQAMREEQQAAILALRKQLAHETEEVLKEQDAKMGILIGKLQAGQARRQGVIKKLDRAVKDLQVSFLGFEIVLTVVYCTQLLRKHIHGCRYIC